MATDKGQLLVDLMTPLGPMPLEALNRICAHLTQASGDKVTFDWHWQGGHPMLFFRGPHTIARATYLSEGQFLRDTANAHARKWLEENPSWSWIVPESVLGLEEKDGGPSIQ